jgi:hypothetical protein
MFLSLCQIIDSCNIEIGKNIYINETIKVVLNSDNVSYVRLHKGCTSLSAIWM